jgi:ankyrin repeat protein
MSPKIKRRAEVIGDSIARTKPKRGVVFQKEEAKRLVEDSVVLVSAVWRDNISDAAKFLDGGVDIQYKDKYGIALLHRAVILRKETIVQLFLKRGADTNTVVSPTFKSPICGCTPLHFACKHCGQDLLPTMAIARLLLSFGADITLTDPNSKTSLDYAYDAEEKQELYEYHAQLLYALLSVGDVDVK